jgi:hypothetical protein
MEDTAIRVRRSAEKAGKAQYLTVPFEAPEDKEQ